MEGSSQNEIPSIDMFQLEVTGNIYNPIDNAVNLKNPFTHNGSVNDSKLVKIFN